MGNNGRSMLAATVVLLIACGVFFGYLRVGHARYPDGMDPDRDGVISRAEWLAYHKAHPVSYNGVADDGSYLGAGNYNGEFDRVDCDHNNEMDRCEFKQLHWNLRSCNSTYKPKGLRAWRECLFE